MPARFYALITSCTAHSDTCLVTGVELRQQTIHHVHVAPDMISDSATFYTEHQGDFIYENISYKENEYQRH
jgi:hypothetical protein